MTRGMRTVGLLAALFALWALWHLDSRSSIEGAAPAVTTGPDAVRRTDDPQLAGTESRLREPVGATPRSAYGEPDPGAASIAGRVVDPAGEAVPGASVSCSHAGPVSTDAAGRFTLDALPPGEHGLWADAEGFAAIPPPPVRAPDGSRVEGVSLVLAPARVLAGTLLADEGASVVEGARVTAMVQQVADFDAPLPRVGPWSEPRIATSGPGGEFRLVRLPPGRVELRVAHPDYASFGRIYTSGAEDVSILLSRVGSVNGRVVGANERPVAIERVSVLVSTERASGPWRLLGQPTDVGPGDASRGFFRVQPRTRHWLRVVVEGPELRRVVSDAFRLDESFGYGPLVLRAGAGPRLSGGVSDELGRPVHAAEVTVVEVKGPAGLPLASKPTLTGPDGVFQSSPLSPGEYRVEARREGHFPARVEAVLVEGTGEVPPLQVVLTRGGAIRGRVFAPGGGTLPELQVRALVLDGGPAGSGREDPEPERVHPLDGTFHFSCLAPGVYRLLLVQGNGDPLHEVDIQVVVGQVSRIALDLDDVGRTHLHGTLTLNGVPVPSAVVSLGRTPESSAWHCTTDRAGEYHFAGVGLGPFVLTAHVGVAGDFVGHGRVDVSGREDSRRDLNLMTGAVSGRVLDEHQRPLAEARIVIEQELDGFGIRRIARADVDSAGRFECAALPAGGLLLSTTLEYRDNVRRRPIHVRGQLETPLGDLVLAPTGSIMIHVKRPTPSFLAGDIEVEVRRRGDGSLVKRSRFSKGERLVVVELPAGPVEVLVRSLGGRGTGRRGRGGAAYRHRAVLTRAAAQPTHKSRASTPLGVGVCVWPSRGPPLAFGPAMKRILFTSVCRPIGPDHGDAPSVGYELLHGQVTRAQSFFSPRSLHLHFSLEYIAENLEAPCAVLQYPSRKELIRELKRGYDYVGVSFLLAVFHRMKDVVELVRRYSPSSKIILGGYGTVLPDDVLAPWSDHVCREEGVTFMRRLLDEPPIERPYRHPLIVSELKVFGARVSRTGMIFAGLGCPNGCDFCCTSHFFKRRHIKLLPTGEDIYRVVERYTEIDPEISLVVLDEDFLLNKRRALEFRDCVVSGGRALSLFVFASIRAISQFTVEEIVEMGIDGLWIGYEGTRSNYAKQKGRPPEELFRELRSHGISILASMIVGLPYQDEEIVERELDGLLSLEPDLGQFLIFGPTPGTPFYERVMEEGLLRGDLAADRELYYKTCDGFSAMVEHPVLSTEEIETLQRHCFDEDYRRLGPSVYRSLGTWFEGFRTLRRSRNPALRRKAERFAREIRRAYPVFFAGRMLGPNRSVRRRIGRLQEEVHALIGRPTVPERLRAIAAVGLALWTAFTLKLRLFQQPRLVRHAYRLPERGPKPARIWRRLIQLERTASVELRPERTVWVRLDGVLRAEEAARLASQVKAALQRTRNRLVLDMKRLTELEGEAAQCLAQILSDYRERIRILAPASHCGVATALAAFSLYHGPSLGAA